MVLGLDPDPSRLWPAAVADESGGGSTGQPDQRAARAVLAHCRLAIQAVAEECVGVKLQLACFERLGASGWAALQAVAELAREHSLLVIADAKRGDIDVSAAAYAQAFLGETDTDYGQVPGIRADALTANPLLGADSLAPLVRTARSHGAGVFVLVRTSNPGAADIQELSLAGGGTVSDRLAELVARIGADGIGGDGLSDVGAVVGATAPQRLAELREQMPHAPLLIPGVGAQGGEVDSLRAAFSPGPAGGLVTVSRGIVDAHRAGGEEPGPAARRAAAELREAAWALAG